MAGRPPCALAPKGRERMAAATRKSFSNQLLKNLAAPDLAALAPHLMEVQLDLRRVLEVANKPIKRIYFPEQGIVSVVVEGTRDRQSEVGLIGREGMTGINVVMGNDRSPHQSYVQVAGLGHFMKADGLRDAMDERPAIRLSFLHFAQAFMVQASHTAVANGRGKVEARLARWLLMAHDRLEDNAVPLTHEFIALMLNVRRAGVTDALADLKREGLVTVRRGGVIVRDRAGLEGRANGLYGIPESEYRRLIGWRGRGH